MNRLLMTTFAALGLALFAGNQSRAGGPSGNGSGHQSGGSSHQGMSGRQGDHGHTFRANDRFDFGRHGYRRCPGPVMAGAIGITAISIGSPIVAGASTSRPTRTICRSRTTQTSIQRPLSGPLLRCARSPWRDRPLK